MLDLPGVSDPQPTSGRQSEVETQRPRSRWATPLAGGLIVVAATVVYGNSFSGPFVFDDAMSVVDNPTIRQLWPLGQVLSPPRNGETVSGRPLLNLSLALNYALGGTAVWGYHAANLAIHVLNALLLWGILRRTFALVDGGRKGVDGGRWTVDGAGLTASPALSFPSSAIPLPSTVHCPPSTFLAFAIALLWVVHPLATESVTYMIQRAQSLASLFYLLTLYCVIRGAASRAVPVFAPPRGAWRQKWSCLLQPHWYVAAVLACLLGMATKEIMATAPLVVLIYDRLFLAGTFAQALRRRWGLYLGLAATWGLLAYLVFFTGLLVRRHEFGSPDAWSYARSQPGVILYYLRLCVWPHPLCIEYAWPVAKTWGEILPGTVVLAALMATTVWGLIGGRRGAFLGACFFLMLAPTSSVVPLGGLACEHWMYLPLAVVLTALVLGAHRVGQSLIRRGIVTPAAATIVAGVLTLGISSLLGFLTFQRNVVYLTAVTIWEDAAAKEPWNDRAHNNLGVALAGCGQVDEAIAHFEKALEIKPDFTEAHNNLGLALAGRGRFDEAIAHYQKALKIEPDYADAHNNLGNALASRGQVDVAIAHFKKALEIRPDFEWAHNNLGLALAGRGQVEAAIAHYQKALEIKPDGAEVHNNLGLALAGCGQAEAAIAHYQKALEIKPDYATAHNNLGLALAGRGQVEAAIVHYQKAVEIKPDYGKAHLNLSLALAQNGRIRAAIEHGNQAVRLMPGQPLVSRFVAWLLATHEPAEGGDPPRAVELAEQACVLTGRRDAACLDTLAAAYAAAGQFDKAVETGMEAQRLADAAGQRPQAEAIEMRLELYRDHKPYREPAGKPSNR